MDFLRRHILVAAPAATAEAGAKNYIKLQVNQAKKFGNNLSNVCVVLRDAECSRQFSQTFNFEVR